MKYTDEQRLQRIYDNAVRLNHFITAHNIKEENLISDYALQWLVTTPLYNIGEHVSALSDEFKNAHSAIEWKLITGLRHRLVHDYDGINWSIIAKVIMDELPGFIAQIKPLINAQTNINREVP